MSRRFIVVADASRARFFTIDDQPDAAERGRLTEHDGLADPSRRLRPSEQFTDTRPGLDRAPTGRGFALDDHREHHLAEADQRFAAAIREHIAALSREHHPRDLVLVAPPRMLGHLRRAGADASLGIEVHELARDLTRLPAAALHDHLADAGLLDERPRAAPSHR